MKSVTLKHVGFRCEGTALLNLWGGGQGEVTMDSWDVDTDVNIDKCVNGVNDGQFGCESIESAKVRIYDLYEKGYTEYNSTVDFEAEQIKNAQRGIRVEKNKDEYYTLINQDCYAPDHIGRTLTQDEVDKVVEICDGYDEGNWGEEHLIEALKEFAKTL